jgi:hypothetical protein
MTEWQGLLSRPAPEDHFVQCYRDDRDLAGNVIRYLKEGAERGDCMIVVSTSAHLELFTTGLRNAGVDPENLRRTGKLMLLDARATLTSLLVDGMPDPSRFETLVGQRIRECRMRAGHGGVRAYGEMVDLLWQDGKLAAALRLEACWNRLLANERVGLFCSYSMDLLHDPGESLLQVLSTHSHLLPLGGKGELGPAIDRAMGEVLGASMAAALMPLIRANHFPRVQVPQAEAAVLWLRHNLAPYADKVLSRAQAYFDEACTR